MFAAHMKRGGGLILPTTAFRYTAIFFDLFVQTMPVLFTRGRGGRSSARGRLWRPPPTWSGRRQIGRTVYFRRRGQSILAGGGPNRVGPPLRSGVITGSSRPLVPRAGTSYPTLVPGPRVSTRELKYIDNTGGGPLVTGGNYVTSLNDMLLPGSGINSREGQNTRFMGLRVKGTFTALASSTDWCIPSILIVYDKQPEAAVPPLTDMFDPDLISGSVSTFSLPKFGTRDRYKILYWKAKTVSPVLAGGTSYVVSSQFRNTSFDLNCNLPVTYRAPNTVGPGQMGLGNVYICFLNFGAAQVDSSWYVRYLFADVD